MLSFRVPGRLARPCSRTLFLLGAALCLGPLHAAAQGQGPGPTPIADLLGDRDNDRVPDRLKESFTVVGTITADPVVLGRTGSVAGLQDRSGGILLYSPDTL
ncbi:MAG: hypothetical protein JO040_06560, partial [Gemmatimonadetes bacterium]|nr:hypothetical protein [Gemmatimonadota bacterium]